MDTITNVCSSVWNSKRIPKGIGAYPLTVQAKAQVSERIFYLLEPVLGTANVSLKVSERIP